MERASGQESTGAANECLAEYELQQLANPDSDGSVSMHSSQVSSFIGPAAFWERSSVEESVE